MRRLLLPALIALTLAGCGNKGALVMPDAVPPRHRAPAPAAVPASPVPATARSTG
ncbi:MAG: lipoprotein [Xanthomonadaceae bacterium]|nr:lipoprotein [Xanthomonadaceae bacterium]MDE2177996.1 lipoprotein [Xanthomonadaceae bacterium]MDE2246537.1 lipoprotein [Xanthomonadaceae bacterium]